MMSKWLRLLWCVPVVFSTFAVVGCGPSVQEAPEPTEEEVKRRQEAYQQYGEQQRQRQQQAPGGARR